MMMTMTLVFLLMTTLLLTRISRGATAMALEIGDAVQTEGYIMDFYCIARGTLLDKSGVKTLEEPEKHSFHCLLDVSFCVDSPFEILLSPDETSGGLYRRGFRVDAAGQQELIRVGRATGHDKDCSTCSGVGSQRNGFYAAVNGTVIALADGDIPPTLEVTGVEAAIGPAGLAVTTATSLWLMAVTTVTGWIGTMLLL